MNAAVELKALQKELRRERQARKKAEQLLEETMAKRQPALALLPGSIGDCEKNSRTHGTENSGLCFFANDNPDPLLRISRTGEILGQNFSAAALLSSFVYKERRLEAPEFWKKVVGQIDFSAPRWSFEARCGDRLFSFACTLHKNQGYMNVYGCDLTGQASVLESSDQKWHFALMAAGDGIWEYNLQTKAIAFSRSYKDLLGFEKEAFLNQERLWRSRIHPSDIHLIDQIIADYAAGKIKQHATQYRIRKRSGNYIWIMDRGVLLDETTDGQPLKIIGVHTNINQQKELELNLQTTANRLGTLISNLHMGIVMEDEKGDLLVCNKRMCEIFGVDYELQKFRRDNMAAMVSCNTDVFCEPELFAATMEEIGEERKAAAAGKWELTDGRFIRRSFIPVYSHEGVFQGKLWVIEDITEQINNEKALKQQRRFYEQILNNIPADVAVFDVDQQYLFVNPVGLKNEVLRKGLFSRHSEAASQYKEALLNVFEERSDKFHELLQTKKLLSWEEEMLRSDGSKEYSLRNLYPVLDGGGDVDMVIGYGFNITERKEIEQKIQLSEKKYRDLINFSYALIITHDVSGNVLTVNPSVCRTLGYTYQELIGKRLSDFMLPSDAVLVETEYLQKILAETMAEGVFRVVSKGGEIIYLLYKNYLFLEEGESPYIIGFAQDISQRIKAEKELKLAKKATEEAAVAKERFLADMSHEIRTPMNGILGLASLLEKSALDGKQKEQLHLLKESANNLLIIVNDVLDLEKIASGKMELEKIPFAVLQKVQSSIASFRFKSEEKGLVLKHRNSLPEDLAVLGDPYRLSQILNNLLSNALKFTNEGSIAVSTRLHEQGKGRVLIEYEVADSGIGIPADKLQQIFNPYVQARPEISRKYGGTGLGLAICKNLVQMQDGTIQLESREGEGSRFIFRIPYEVVKAAPKAAVTDAESPRNVLEGKNILVAEDVQINQYLIRHFLSGTGCLVKFVDNGKHAVEEVEHRAYDLVLMDIQMPEMDGTEATRLIRQFKDKNKAAVPIIALTANALKGADAKYLAAGMDGYLSKPYTKEKLLETIAQTWNKQAQRLNPACQRAKTRTGNEAMPDE